MFSDDLRIFKESEAEEEKLLVARDNDAGGFNRRDSGNKDCWEEEAEVRCELLLCVDTEESAWVEGFDWTIWSGFWSLLLSVSFLFESEELSDFELTCEPRW